MLQLPQSIWLNWLKKICIHWMCTYFEIDTNTHTHTHNSVIIIVAVIRSYFHFLDSQCKFRIVPVLNIHIIQFPTKNEMNTECILLLVYVHCTHISNNTLDRTNRTNKRASSFEFRVSTDFLIHYFTSRIYDAKKYHFKMCSTTGIIKK